MRIAVPAAVPCKVTFVMAADFINTKTVLFAEISTKLLRLFHNGVEIIGIGKPILTHFKLHTGGGVVVVTAVFTRANTPAADVKGEGLIGFHFACGVYTNKGVHAYAAPHFLCRVVPVIAILIFAEVGNNSIVIGIAL